MPWNCYKCGFPFDSIIHKQKCLTKLNHHHKPKQTFIEDYTKLTIEEKIQLIKQHKKEQKRRSRANRRQLGFIPINKPFEGAEGHHLDNEFVVYIPKELHQSVSHSVLKNINMNEINNKAYRWLSQHPQK